MLLCLGGRGKPVRLTVKDGWMLAASAVEWVAAIGSAATAVGVLLALLAYWGAQRTAQADHYFQLMNHLQQETTMAARRTLLEHWDSTGEPVSTKNSSEAVLLAAGVTASSFSTAGRVVALGYVSPTAFLSEYSPLIVRIHDILRPYLEQRRDGRSDPGYHASFSKIAAWAAWWLEWELAPGWKRVFSPRRPWRRLSCFRVRA